MSHVPCSKSGCKYYLNLENEYQHPQFYLRIKRIQSTFIEELTVLKGFWNVDVSSQDCPLHFIAVFKLPSVHSHT